VFSHIDIWHVEVQDPNCWLQVPNTEFIFFERYLNDTLTCRTITQDLGARISEWWQRAYNLRMTWSLPADTAKLLRGPFPAAAKHLQAGLVEGDVDAQRRFLQDFMVSARLTLLSVGTQYTLLLICSFSPRCAGAMQ
jgi:hypothetical protein